MAVPPEGNRLRANLGELRSRLESQDSFPAAELAEAVQLLQQVLDRLDAENQAMAEQLWRCLVEQSALEERLSRLENSFLFRSLRSIGFRLRTYKLKFGQKLLKSPFHQAYLKLIPAKPDPIYASWIRQQEAQAPSWEWHREQAQRWSYRPLISVVMAVHDPRREWLEAAVKSVFEQSYPFWELCVCDNGSPAWVAEYLRQRAEQDPRLRYDVSPQPLGISGALNRAGSLARGEYVAFLDHDDLLSPLALHYVAECLQDGPADAIYTDEDYLDSTGRRTRPSLKPDWSPDLLLDCMYWGHFLVLSRHRLQEIGGFRSEYDGAQDYDVALRLTDDTAVVRHVPRILYHWRQHPGSTAADPGAKPYTHAAGFRALQSAIERRRWNVEAADGTVQNAYSVRWRLSGKPRVSIVVCSRNSKLLSRFLRALDRTWRNHECQIVMVHHQVGADAEMDKVLRQCRCEVVPFREEFNFARMNNLGATASEGGVLFFLNDDVMPVTEDWMDLLLGHLERPDVGAVGAKLIYPQGAIQHAGIVLGMMEGAGHLGRGIFRSDLWRWLDQTRNVSAVTGACLGMRRALFKELGGFDEGFPVNYNDVDLCLRARKAGYEVIYEPRAVLRHDECQTRIPGTRRDERERFHRRWAELLNKPDPYYNPQLSLATEDIRLAMGSLKAPGPISSGNATVAAARTGSL